MLGNVVQIMTIQQSQKKKKEKEKQISEIWFHK